LGSVWEAVATAIKTTELRAHELLQETNRIALERCANRAETRQYDAVKPDRFLPRVYRWLTVQDNSPYGEFSPPALIKKLFEAAKGFAVIDGAVLWRLRLGESASADARTATEKRRNYSTYQNVTSSDWSAAES